MLRLMTTAVIRPATMSVPSSGVLSGSCSLGLNSRLGEHSATVAETITRMSARALVVFMLQRDIQGELLYFRQKDGGAFTDIGADDIEGEEFLSFIFIHIRLAHQEFDDFCALVADGNFSGRLLGQAYDSFVVVVRLKENVLTIFLFIQEVSNS